MDGLRRRNAGVGFAGQPEAPRVAVVGLGNVLMEDDAFGPHVVQVLLAQHEFPSDVAVLDLGTPGLDLTPYITDVDALIVVDTVRSRGKPGELLLYRRADILRHPPYSRLSPHDPGLKEALLLTNLVGRGPREVLLVGVIPDGTRARVGLSPPVRAAVPRAADEVRAELARLGIRPVLRRAPCPPDIWWEESGGATAGPA